MFIKDPNIDEIISKEKMKEFWENLEFLGREINSK